MNFRELLQKYGFTTTSQGIQKKVKAYEKLEKAIEQSKAALTTETAARKRKSLERDISEGDAELISLNEDLIAAIENYNKNKDRYAHQAANFKRNGQQQPPIDPPADPPVPNDPPADPPAPIDPPADPPVPNDPPADPPQEPANPDGPTKKSSGIGWIIGGIVLIAGAAVGINLYNRK